MSDPSRPPAGPPDAPTTAVAHVRAAGREDIPAILALWGRARSANASTPDTAGALERLLATGPGTLLVAEDRPGGVIVGALVAAWDGWRGNMYRLAVDPAYRRRGIGLALVRAGERRLRARGARRITALVAHEDSDAVALWAAAGYARDETIARFVRSLD
jgi:ribosomal protein S18 acetylase RimI-like enzyme